MKIEFLGSRTKEELERRLQIVASAGTLSRFEGTVTQVLETNQDYEKNLKLARAVVGYGHKSIAEHDYLLVALENVTPIVEQTIIGYRLTSFTIKSRRNVDFSNAGFYVPDFKDSAGNVLAKNAQLQETYKTYMQSLFHQYSEFVNEGLPIEDCRYILPYSYHSNIIMGCDANEFLNMTGDMLYGKISQITEIRELGEKFAEMIEKDVPYLTRALEQEKTKAYYEDKLSFVDSLIEKDVHAPLLEHVQLLHCSNAIDHHIIISSLMARYQCTYGRAEYLLEELLRKDPEIERKIMRALYHSKHQRELEQAIVAYQIPISLAVLTHITRHRMHSLLVPDFTSFDLGNYITPATIAKEHKGLYQEVFKRNQEMRESFAAEGVRSEDLVYFLLSGNACNITTTMNARTLMWISRMRCCKKAQWEIRDIVNQMVELARIHAPLLGEGLGASCQVFGECPEGKDSCKNRGVVVKKLTRNDESLTQPTMS